jgi:hypothetical protein
LAAEPTEGVRLLGRAEERARYARAPLAASGLAESLVKVRSAIIERASRRTRLRALVLPPSVIRRWRSTSTERFGTAAARLSHGQEALARAASPRRLLPGRR